MASSDRAVFITGGALGIGAATVAAFVRDGHKVGVVDTNIGAGKALEERFGRDTCRFFAGDVRRGADIGAAVRATEAAFGPLGVVFANAGVHRFNSILDVTEADLDLLVDINIKGTVRTLAEAVPRLVAAGGGAVVINASDQALIGKRNSLVYGLTKGALGQMAKSLALDLAPHGIRVNAVCPGTTRTALTEAIFDRLPDPAAAWAAEAATYPAGRVGTAEDVAELVVFLASDRASFITGSLHSVDGGLTAG